VIFTTAHSYLLFFSNKGRVYRLRGMEIPERDRTARGIPIVNLLPLKQGETIQAVIDTRDFAVERFLFFATRQGQVKKTKFTEYDSSRKDGLIALRLREKDELVRVIETSGSDDVVMVSKQGFVSRFAEKGVRPMGRGAAGVKGMKLRAGDELVSIDAGRRDGAVLMITSAGYGKRTPLKEFKRKGRGSMGTTGIKLTGKKGSVVAAFMAGKEDHIVVVASTGQTIRLRAEEVSSQSRAATGVRLMSLDGDQLVASAALIFSHDTEE
jgi:DNA gyrase subunit A